MQCTIAAGGRQFPVSALPGAFLALLSAALFGASTPLAKLLLRRDIGPVMLAGLLYLGAGGGLLAFQGARRLLDRGARPEAALRGREWLWLGLATLLGGVIAPGLLMYGLNGAPAAATALLLNLEPVFTVLLAWLVFGEGAGRRVVLGMAIIVGGTLLLAWPGAIAGGRPGAMVAVAGACLGWAVDNNLTRKVSLTDPVQIASIKGSAAGAVNVVAARWAGAAMPSPGEASAAALLGLLGYGVSLVLFVRALREVGTARTGAYFSLAPFFGALLSVAVLGEKPSGQLVGAGLLMGAGVWLHLTERHGHEHAHREVQHEHAHVHDAHHRHDATDPRAHGEAHVHRHAHPPLVHRHPHFPDPHHRHPH